MDSDEWEILRQVSRGINATKADLISAQNKNRLNQNAFFTLLMALVIFMMQTGFAFLEAGAVRAKNCTNILAKNLLDSLITIIGYWSVGWALAYGRNSQPYLEPFFGASEFFNAGIDNFARFFFQYVFAARASTIISGGVAERCEFFTFIVYSILVSSAVYPILTHWGWSDSGWLRTGITIGSLHPTTYIDIAGSGVVHLCGGTIALVAAFLMRPRIGRFPSRNNPTTERLYGHSVPLVALGGFILMFGFLAFNGGAIADISVHGAGQSVALAMINTILCGAFAALTCMFIKNWRHGKLSLLHTINACLTGMVSTCAGCHLYNPWATPFVGVGASFIYMFLSALVSRMRVDDALDSFAVHAGGGFWGLIAVCLFGKTALIPALYNGNGVLQAIVQLAWNFISALVIMLWSAATMAPIFLLLKCVGKFRVSDEVETKGLDYSVHGETAYPLVAYGHGWTTLSKASLPFLDVVTEMDTIIHNGDDSVTVFHNPSAYTTRTSNSLVQRNNRADKR